MKAIVLGLLVATACLSGQQSTYDVETCRSGELCTRSTVTVRPQSRLDTSIPLQYHSPEIPAPQPWYRAAKYRAAKRPKRSEWKKLGTGKEWFTFFHNGEHVGEVYRSNKKWMWKTKGYSFAQAKEAKDEKQAKLAVEQAIAN